MQERLQQRKQKQTLPCLNAIYFLRFYLFIHERHTQRERQRPRQREKQAPRGEPEAGFDPGTPGSCPGLKAAAQPLSPPRALNVTLEWRRKLITGAVKMLGSHTGEDKAFTTLAKTASD